MYKHIEEIREIIDNLKTYLHTHSNAIVIVEGKKDKNALISLGIDTNYIVEIRFRSYGEILYLLQDKNVIDFLDEDKEGESLRCALRKMNLHLISTFRRELFSLMHIKTTEALITSYKQKIM